MIFFTIIFCLIGVFSFGYYFAILTHAGVGVNFSWIWMIAGVFCTLFSTLLYFLYRQKIIISIIIRVPFLLFLLLGVCIFLFLEYRIILTGNESPTEYANYIIILGAQVKGNTISRALQNRLDKAYEYLKKNPQTTAIMTGGKGKGEYITEAQAMKDYLLSKGIASERIQMEDKSKDTNENIINSIIFIKDKTQSIVIVTNKFHVWRAIQITKNKGLTNVSGLGAPTDDILTLHYYVREFFAVIKDMVYGNIHF